MAKKMIGKINKKNVVKEELVQIPKSEIEMLPIDHTNEGLNNIARKINELIHKLNAL